MVTVKNDVASMYERLSGSVKSEKTEVGITPVVVQSDKRYVYAAIVLTLINLAYWTAYNVNIFNALHLTPETALSALSMFYFTHFSNLLHGFQFILFATHMAPDQLLVVPLFYLFPSALTLTIIKAVLLSGSGLQVFFIARGLSNNHKFSLALTFAYFFNPGTIMAQLAEYHVDLFLVPFYLLTFYFWMKLDKKWFYVSLLLLLATFESVLSIVFALGFGLLAYEYFYEKDAEKKKQRTDMALMVIALTVLALVFYNFAYYQVTNIQRSLLPPHLDLPPYPFVPIFNGASYNYPAGYYPSKMFSYIGWAAGAAVIAFGSLSALVAIATLLFIGPWLGGIFILHNTIFLYGWRNTYMIPGAVIGTILGYGALMRSRFKIPVVAVIVVSVLIVALLLLPLIIRLSTFQPNSEILYFQYSQSELQGLSQFRSIVSLIPGNASLMTQQNLYPYFTDRRYIEFFANGSYYFKPQFILVDPNETANIADNQLAYVNGYLGSGNYILVARNGSAYLFERNSSRSG